VSVLSRPRHPVIAEALAMARAWCAGHVIDGAPALGHAVRVALTLGEHVPDPPADLVAAVLLHDAPEYAPPGVNLDAVLSARLGRRVVEVVRALEREHHALTAQPLPLPHTDDPWTVQASAANKIVSLTSILRRSATAPDPDAYWRARQPFTDRIPYFRAFTTAAAPHVPSTMAAELERLITQTDRLLADRAPGTP